MQHYLEKYEKYAAWIFFAIMILALIPMAVLGFYNHPLGDDFYYGYRASLVWQETGNIFKVLATAFAETINQYYEWQGTYSAMFFMHLSPQIWGDIFYKIYPTILLSCFVASIFYLTHTLLCFVLKASRNAWILITSLLVLTYIEQVPLCGETFFWYNGSMYYTGFLAVTFVFWGLLIKGLNTLSLKRTLILSCLAVFLAGGNYISLLPTMIVLVLFILYYLYQIIWKKEPKQKQLVSLCFIFVCILGGFVVSALAPGNAVRQATAPKMAPIKAVLRSIYQNTRYCFFWNGIWSLLFFVGVTPVYLRVIEKCTWKFRYPILICGLIFGIYCSSSCPTFYAQSNGGAARVFCLVYYMMILALAFIYFYALGAVSRFIAFRNYQKSLVISELVIIFCFVLMFCIRSWEGVWVKPHSMTAMGAIVSGEAAYYEQQYQERLAVLKDSSISDVTFTPYDVPQSLIYFLYLGDISSDEKDDVNQRMSAVYGKNSIKILTSGEK